MAEVFAWDVLVWALRIAILAFVGLATLLGILFSARFLRWSNVKAMLKAKIPTVDELKIGELFALSLSQTSDNLEEQITAMEGRLREVEDKQRLLDARVETIDTALEPSEGSGDAENDTG